MVMVATGLRLAPIVNVVSTAALQHLFWPHVRIGQKQSPTFAIATAELASTPDTKAGNC
jgi:hypothetical protein